MAIEKPEMSSSSSSGRRGGSSTMVFPQDDLRYADQSPITRDANAPATPDFSKFAQSSNPIEQLLFNASQQPMDIERLTTTQFSSRSYRTNGASRSETTDSWKPETHTAADVAWHAGGSALAELAKLQPEKQTALLAPEGAADMVLRHPQTVLESAKKVEMETGKTMFRGSSQSLAEKIGDKAGDMRSAIQGLASAMQGKTDASTQPSASVAERKNTGRAV